MTDQTADITLRDRVRVFLEQRRVTNIIMAVIVFNAITLGLSTSETITAVAGDALRTIDNVVLGIFVVEIVLKLYAYGRRFFSNAWNIFDLAVVAVGLMPDQGVGHFTKVVAGKQLWNYDNLEPNEKKLIL